MCVNIPMQNVSVIKPNFFFLNTKPLCFLADMSIRVNKILIKFINFNLMC